jgi:AraC family transcriptional regulator, arabinose operon regulatory protein
MPLRKNRFPVSLYATPNAVHQDVFYTVPRAGHLIGGTEHHVQREHFPGHELILCLRGRGFVRVQGRRHAVEAGQFVWVNCHHPHEHGADGRDPWEVLWVRVEGPRLARICSILSADSAPVFAGFNRRAAEPRYREVFELMASDAPEAAALIHATVARLIALAFVARQRQAGSHPPEIPVVLSKAVQRMRLFYFERQTLGELAALCGMSESHFSRIFKAAFGTSPIDWLRRERINQAKRRLVETVDAIKEIAGQVGYSDRFFFSKDFKQLTGQTPREFRQREQSKRG